MDITYYRKGDYLFPNLFLPAEKHVALGRFGRMRKNYLREHRPNVYQVYLLDGKLTEHLAEIDETAYEAFNRLVDQMAKNENITEQLKEEDQMLWVQKMNSVYARAEEIVLNEYVYN